MSCSICIQVIENMFFTSPGPFSLPTSLIYELFFLSGLYFSYSWILIFAFTHPLSELSCFFDTIRIFVMMSSSVLNWWIICFIMFLKQQCHLLIIWTFLFSLTHSIKTFIHFNIIFVLLYCYSSHFSIQDKEISFPSSWNPIFLNLPFDFYLFGLEYYLILPNH